MSDNNKSNERRRIHIEDKRGREEQQAQAAAADDGNGQSPGEAAALNDALLEFSEPGGSDAQDTGAEGFAPGVAGTSQLKKEPEKSPEQLAGEYLELAQRKEAELRNLRKRQEQDMADARRYAVEALLSDLFPALDGLAQAANTYKDTPPGENPLLDGVRSTIKTLERALAKHGIERIEEAGVPFDSNLHQPLQVEENSEVIEEMVGEVYVQGYRLGDVVLKPAMVKVVKPE
jgi:molecular chaperone GrpE